jgi:hypothetical protein
MLLTHTPHAHSTHIKNLRGGGGGERARERAGDRESVYAGSRTRLRVCVSHSRSFSRSLSSPPLSHTPSLTRRRQAVFVAGLG